MKKLLLTGVLASMCLIAHAENYNYLTIDSYEKEKKVIVTPDCPSSPEPGTYLLLCVGILLITIVVVNKQDFRKS